MDWRLSHPDWEGWGGAKKTKTKTKKLLHEIILRFGLPRSLQTSNETSFTSKVTQGVSEALGTTYYLHCAWRPQSSGKIEKANQFLKSVIKKITQETSLGWKEVLPKTSFTGPPSVHVLPLRNRLVLVLIDAIWEIFCLCQWPLPRSRGSDPLVLYHGHWEIPTGYTLVVCELGPKRL